jgi:hypothetical protein
MISLPVSPECVTVVSRFSESEANRDLVLFIVLFQNQTSNTFGEGTYSSAKSHGQLHTLHIRVPQTCLFTI